MKILISRFQKQRAATSLVFLWALFFAFALTLGVLPAYADTAPRAPRAMWVWDAAVIMQSATRTQLFEFCRAKNISILYVHLGDFLNEKSAKKTTPNTFRKKRSAIFSKPRTRKTCAWTRSMATRHSRAHRIMQTL